MAVSKAGNLLYLVGPSGVGKDTLIRAIAADFENRPGLRAARRYITRAPDPDGEQNRELDETEFDRLEAHGDFLFSWSSHGYRYAVGNEILAWLEAGEDVVVNGSRHYLERAREIYPALIAIWMTVDEAVLRERLGMRGREGAAEIEARIERGREFELPRQPGEFVLDNSGPIETALAEFQRLRERAKSGAV